MIAIALGPECLVGRQVERWQSLRTERESVIIEHHGSIAVAHKDGPRVHWSQEGEKLLIGDIFGPVGTSMDATDQLPATAHDLTTFTAGFWGRYLLFARTGATGHFAFRDPSGAIPLYRLALDGISGFVSDAPSARWFGKTSLDPDPDFLRQWLGFPFLRTARCGDVALREVLPGQAILVGASEESERAIWTPARTVTDAPAIVDPTLASAELRRVLLAVIPAFVGRHCTSLVQLSGGLDSSIICAALSASGIAFEGVNYRTGHSDSDERVYARATARAGGIELHEVKGSIANLQGSVLPPSFRPLPNLALRPLHVALDGLARQRGARALIDGAGGDNVFCYLTTAAPILDAYRMIGWSGARMALHDIARLCETTWWDALAATLRRARRRRRLWNADHSFLHPEAQPACPDDHPWLSFDPEILPGKCGHIEALVTIQHFLDRGQPLISVPMIHPLLAQPLMELCLRIPSFLWSRSGINRAVARDAMRGLVPLSVANRRTKGGLGSMFLMTFMHNRLALRDYLMDGSLASRGLLDRAALDAALSHSDEPADDRFVRILEIAALEDWLRSWRR